MILQPCSPHEFRLPIILGALVWTFASLPHPTWLPARDDGKIFASPESGIASLAYTVRKKDEGALSSLIGDTCSSAVIDWAVQKSARRAEARLSEGAMSKNSATVAVSLQLGDDEVPLRLVRTGGTWRFDTAQGCDALLARRIDHNESSAIKASLGFAGARREGPSARRHSGHAAAHAYDGYYYRLVDSFPPPKGDANVNGPSIVSDVALVAYPASYGVSGVMTFIVDHKGVIYKKDLGPDTVLEILEHGDLQADGTWQAVKTPENASVRVPIPSRAHEEVASAPAARSLVGARHVAAQ